MYPDHHDRTVERPSDQAAVLLVDDDAQWARATARLLEADESALEVTIAADLATGREQVRSNQWDCVVCDYQLGDGTGFDLLETVQEVTTDCPFLLVTGRGDEEIASRAIRRGVTDYIIKNHDDSAATLLGNRVRNAIVSARRQRQLDREHHGKAALLDLLRSQPPTDGLLDRFCHILVENNRYAGAWVGAIDSGPEPTIVPQAVEGCQPYLDAVVGATGIQQDSPDPAGRLLGRDEPVVVSLSDPPDGGTVPTGTRLAAEDWAPVAREFGLQTGIALPITYDGVRIGILGVYLSADEPPLTSRRWAVLTEYADVVGLAQQNAELKRSLLEDPAVRLDVEITDPSVPLAELTAALEEEASVRVLSTARHDDGQTQYLVETSEVPVEALEAAARDARTFELASLTTTAEGVRFDVRSTVRTPEASVTAHGGTVGEITASEGTVNVRLAATDYATAGAITDELDGRFETVTVTALWNSDADVTRSTASPLADLTDRQASVIRHAYFSGYFERPRVVSATELADTLGIARATMTQHLRAAQRKLLGAVLEE